MNSTFNRGTAAIAGVNFGKTLSQAAPRSALRRDLQNLLTEIFSQQRT